MTAQYNPTKFILILPKEKSSMLINFLESLD